MLKKPLTNQVDCVGISPFRLRSTDRRFGPVGGSKYELILRRHLDDGQICGLAPSSARKNLLFLRA